MKKNDKVIDAPMTEAEIAVFEALKARVAERRKSFEARSVPIAPDVRAGSEA